MLDNVTKKNIDDCRDILVGIVPDPKSQIEQITLALIYKFMDDMDKETVEKFKGKAKFFTGEYAKYGWRKLFDPSLSGKDMLELYSEALDKLQINPNIPELFRNIFKNASLPYRNPPTLKLFLKHINEFEYSHSEKLGDAFEYLLSVMGSQGDAGQFRTPRNIIDFIVACVNPQKNETVADVACGTSGFLLSAYKHILKQNTDKRSGDKLTPDQRKKFLSNFTGYDISPDMVRLSLANMYLHGFATPQIYAYDTLSDEARWNETFDVILANPPFMTPKGGITPHKKFGVQANKAEVLFTDYIAEHLNNNGRAGIVVPNGIVATTQNAYKQLRKMLVSDSLIAVVSLPAGCFNPYSGVKTSILLLDKALAKRSNHILFLKIENDGYDLGAQRREIDKNDLPFALEAFTYYKQSISEGKPFDEEKYNSICLLVEKEKVLANKHISLNADKYKESSFLFSSDFDLVKVEEICELVRGSSPRPQGDPRYYGGSVPRLMIADVTRDGMYSTPKIDFLTEEGAKKSRPMKKGEVVMAVSGNAGLTTILAVDACIHDGFVGFRQLSEEVNPHYFYYILNHIKDENKGKADGAVFQNLTTEQIKEFEIPLPPLETQEQIVKEIDYYQKVIDGAKMVVENYKPTIAIKPEWEMVAVKELTHLITKGSSPRWQGINYTTKENGILFITSENVGDGELRIDEKKYVEKKFNDIEKKSILKKGDLLTNLVGASIGRSAIYNLDDVANINQAVGIIRLKKELASNEYLCYFFNTDYFIKLLLGNTENNARANVGLGSIGNIAIPLPSLEEQNEIVGRIEQEKELIAANKKLIALFEQKIKKKINSVWGVEED